MESGCGKAQRSAKSLSIRGLMGQPPCLGKGSATRESGDFQPVSSVKLRKSQFLRTFTAYAEANVSSPGTAQFPVTSPSMCWTDMLCPSSWPGSNSTCLTLKRSHGWDPTGKVDKGGTFWAPSWAYMEAAARSVRVKGTWQGAGGRGLWQGAVAGCLN